MSDGPETWTLQHPEHGLLQVAVARPVLLRRLDPGYRRDDKNVSASYRPGVVVLREGAPIARATTVAPHRIDLSADPLHDEPPLPRLRAGRGPRVVLETDSRQKAVRQVRLHSADAVFDFVPPPGSDAEHRLLALDASPWKRVALPFVSGLGRAGAVVMGMVVVALLAPVIGWLRQLLPDVHLPLPSIDVPVPAIDLPSVPQLPDWTDPWLETSRIWTPVVVGLLLGLMAARTARRARRTAARGGTGDDAATDE